MGTVYRAIHRRLNRPRAVKVLPSNLADDPTFIARFEREARLAAGLEHPNIVRVYDVGDQDGAYYIAMELLSGRSLRRVLRDDRPLTVERVLALLRQLAAALDFAHGQGVVHRDVKPDNATVDAHDHLTLVDFGLARAADGTSLTRNNVMGTVEYMAPEVLLEQPAGPHGESGDLYALGITAYELLVGRMPFTGTISAKIIHDQLHTPPPSPRALNPSLPQAAEAVILRQLSKRPSERYVTAGAFVDALTASLGTSDSRDPSSELDEDRRRDQIELRKRKRPREVLFESIHHRPCMLERVADLRPLSLHCHTTQWNRMVAQLRCRNRRPIDDIERPGRQKHEVGGQRCGRCECDGAQFTGLVVGDRQGV